MSDSRVRTDSTATATATLDALQQIAREIQRMGVDLNELQRRRDRKIADALGLGLSERVVGAAAGLSGVRVHQIKQEQSRG